MPAPNEVYRYHSVWDPLLRGLHWWMVVTLLTQIALGVAIMLFGEELSEAGEETLLTLHTLFGYLFGAGLITRILWLLIGTPTARLRDMLPISKAFLLFTHLPSEIFDTFIKFACLMIIAK